MYRRVPILAAAVSIACTVVVCAADDLVLDRFAAYLESLRAQAGIPGLAASLVGPRDVTRTIVLGRQNIERAVAVSAITPFHLDGGMQIVTAWLVLRCAEEGPLSLDDRLERFKPDAQEPGATLQQLLSHTSGPANALVFSYRLERFDLLSYAVSSCRGESFRKAVADLLDQSGMRDSVPGPDLSAFSASDFDQSAMDHYKKVMDQLATGYTVSGQGSAAPSSYSARTLTPSGGLITTVWDLAQLDLALKKGVLLRANSISTAWTAPLGANGRRLPHGLGWFVQSYNGETVVWQFGAGTASSSMVVTVPGRLLTFILLANSNGLAKGFNLAAGDVSVSPFAKAFLGTFLR